MNQSVHSFGFWEYTFHNKNQKEPRTNIIQNSGYSEGYKNIRKCAKFGHGLLEREN
jgi:hypothetical protein